MSSRAADLLQGYTNVMLTVLYTNVTKIGPANYTAAMHTHCQQLQTYTLVPLTRDTQNQELQGAKAHSYLADVPTEHSLLQPLLCRRVQLQDEKNGATVE